MWDDIQPDGQGLWDLKIIILMRAMTAYEEGEDWATVKVTSLISVWSE